MTDKPKTKPKKEWAIRMNGALVGWPTRLEFETRKEAAKQAQKLQHQSGCDVVVVRISEYLAAIARGGL